MKEKELLRKAMSILVKRRWKGTTKEERKEHSRKMLQKREENRAERKKKISTGIS